MTHTQEARSWAFYANCAGLDTEMFFPKQGRSNASACEVCRGCVVREQCLEYTLENGESLGIWGGLSATKRRQLRRARQRVADRAAAAPPA